MLAHSNTKLNFDAIDASWREALERALNQVSCDYIAQLEADPDWLPGHHALFNAFSLPLDEVRYVLFGESPYPRAQSANGYAFWDAAVEGLWSENGLSKTVNRATSLRNFIKMLLVADDRLQIDDTSQAAIAACDKSLLVNTIAELFTNMQNKGILLLNSSLVLSKKPVRYDAKMWRPFLDSILQYLQTVRPETELILWGKIADVISELPGAIGLQQHKAEHPYNVSFISNPDVLEFFRPLRLLVRA